MDDAVATPDEKQREQSPEIIGKLMEVYGTEEEYKYAQSEIQEINDDLELREQQSLVFNGISYSNAYEYNQRKGINYSPPRSQKDDRQVSMGIVHEKIVGFAAIFLKYMFKRRIKCYDEKGRLVKGMGEIYDLAIEFSYKLEKLKKKLAFIYWETFTQGNAFILEDWEVKLRNTPKAYRKAEDGEKVLVTADSMDYTYEFLDNLTYEKGEDFQTRRAVSRVLDGRQVIFGNPEIEELQEQGHLTLEEEISASDAEQIFGTLKRWASVPKTHQDITNMVGEKLTLFDAKRLKAPDKTFIIHRKYNKETNRFNVYVNGMMMLPRETPMTLFYPRGNYPLSNVPAERLRGSIYARSVPAKTKFNADFVDWALKMLAAKFAQGVDPAILSHGKYTLTRDMFRDGQVTHGVKREDYEFANEEALKGVTNGEFSFVQALKEIIESQSLNQTSTGELSDGNTAFEIAKADAAQIEKLGFLLDGIVQGFADMYERRAETIEAKYTIKQRETYVDGKLVPVYQNFSVNVAGIESVVTFDEEVGSEGYDYEGKRDELFKQSFKDKKAGNPTEYYLANPISLRENKYHLDVEVFPERVKDTQLQLIQMWDDFARRLEIFGQSNNFDEMKKEYLETSGKPDTIFVSDVYKRLDEAEGSVAGGTNMGSFGKPTVKNAQLQERAIVK